MKLLTTISIIAALGLSACDSKSVDSTKAKTEEKVMEEKVTESSVVDTSANTTTEAVTDTQEAVAEKSKEIEKDATPTTLAKITNIYWKLIILKGKEIADAENPHDQPHFMLNTKDNRVTGNDSCNGFFGSYTLAEDNRIKFDQLAGTKRYCADTGVDQNEYLQVFGQADNYRIRDENLELYSGDSEPLAVFEAVDKLE